jgi:murein DD-endopeptidase MepM/ murein hydrolase activator NlpD
MLQTEPKPRNTASTLLLTASSLQKNERVKSFLLKLLLLFPAILSSIPSVANAQVTDGYKGVKLPYAAGQAREVTGTHDKSRRAIDFGMHRENVLAIKSGKVAAVNVDRYGGKYILVDHGDGYCSFYLHLESFKVSQNDFVNQGQVIGVSGNTGLGSQYHLHLAITQKLNSVCTTNNTREIAMVFDEKPQATLKLHDRIISQNGGSSAPDNTFKNPSSKLSVSVPTVDLTVQGTNIAGRTIYVQMFRPAFAGYAAKTWNFQQVATSNTVVFRDMDGAGNTFKGAPYFTVVSLTPFTSNEASLQRTSCFTATGGTRLCDRASR